MFPPAPGRLSTMNCCPVSSLSLAARIRATASLAPPGACGTIIVTGLVGYFSWATATAPTPSAQEANKPASRRCFGFIAVSLSLVDDSSRGRQAELATRKVGGEVRDPGESGPEAIDRARFGLQAPHADLAL